MNKSFATIILFLICQSYTSQIVINEFVPTNTTDEPIYAPAHPDWIELYNSSSSSINLNGYFLSDDTLQPYKWQMPNISIPPLGHVIVWASAKDSLYNGTEIHSNFKLNNDGESLVLSAPDSTLLDFYSYTKIPKDCSYGRQPDGGDWYTFETTTIDTCNYTSAQLLPPEISMVSGLYTDSITVQISSQYTNDTIYYTLDGSDPDPAHIGGHTYFIKQDYSSPTMASISHETFFTTTGVITIQDRSTDTNKLCTIRPTPNWWNYNGINSFKGTSLKFMCKSEGKLPSDIQNNSYFISPAGQNRYSLPITSITTDEKHLFDYYEGIYVPGELYYNNAPNGGYWAKIKANYTQKGENWEKPAHITLIENGEVKLNQNIGVRISGNVSRAWARKSLRLYAREEYDLKNHFNHDFFPSLNKQNSPSDRLTKFKRLTLRNSGNNWAEQLFKDAFMQHIVEHLNIEVQYFSPTVVFLNGEYWGVMNYRQRYDDHYLDDHYDIEEDDAVILEGNSGGIDFGNINDSIHYNGVRNFIDFQDMSSPLLYDSACTMIDVQNFAQLFMTQIYINNTDWLSNNRKCWRKRTSQYIPNASYGQDGRYRWFLYDLDHGFQNPDENRLNIIMSNPGVETAMFRSLMENPEFNRYWINLMADNLNTYLAPQLILPKIDSLNNIYDPEIQEHKARWGNLWSDNSTLEMEEFASERPYYIREQILQQFTTLTDTSYISLNVLNSEGGTIKINTVQINESISPNGNYPYPWTGIYFNGNPIDLVAIPDHGYQFIGWEGISSTSDSIHITFASDTSFTAIFTPVDTITGLHLNELLSKNNNTIMDNYGEYDDFIELYNSTSSTINLAGLFLTDDSTCKHKWKIPPSIQPIAPNNFQIFWADNDTAQGDNHSNFKIGEETIYLYEVVNSDTFLVDFMEALSSYYENISLGRYPDGDTNLIFFDIPTANATNEEPNSFEHLYINEFIADNSYTFSDEYGEFDDWIELYNGGGTPINVGGLYFTDDLSFPEKYRIPLNHEDSTTIAPGDYLIIWADNDSEQGILHTNFKLGSPSEQIGIHRSSVLSTEVIDSISYTQVIPDISYGRYPDGTPNWVFMNYTPEESNISTGVSETVPGFTYTFYPNPTQEEINIKSEQMEKLRVFDVHGKIIKSFNSCTPQMNIQLTGLQSGIYFIELESKGDILREKIILNR